MRPHIRLAAPGGKDVITDIAGAAAGVAAVEDDGHVAVVCFIFFIDKALGQFIQQLAQFPIFDVIHIADAAIVGHQRLVQAVWFGAGFVASLGTVTAVMKQKSRGGFFAFGFGPGLGPIDKVFSKGILDGLVGGLAIDQLDDVFLRDVEPIAKQLLHGVNVVNAAAQVADSRAGVFVDANK